VTTDLKPCPFCNGHNLTVVIDDYFDAVACRDCEASGPTGKNARGAIKAWNTRQDKTNQDEVQP
jgi:Lar family restriction alleviation protein